MERDCESELSKLNIEQNACIYHFGASVIHGQRSNILRLPYRYSLSTVYSEKVESGAKTVPRDKVLKYRLFWKVKNTHTHMLSLIHI